MGLWHQRVFSGINFLPTWDQFSPFQYSEMFGFNHKDNIKSKRLWGVTVFICLLVNPQTKLDSCSKTNRSCSINSTQHLIPHV